VPAPAAPEGRQPDAEACHRVEATGSPSLAFGPVPSRRLGRSLGINNIPPKRCSYSCAYCQVGPTLHRAIEPRGLYSPEQVADAVAGQVARVRERGEAIDHLTFVPDGEPTLDAGLGRAIELLRPLGVPIAVISNGSLLWRAEVRRALMAADWVSVKVDAASEEVWRRVNRPDPRLDLSTVQEGIVRFAAEFGGTLVSETMLVRGHNDTPDEVAGVGQLLAHAGIATAYLAIPTRPTPHPSVRAATEEAVNEAYQTLRQHVPRVELLIGYEGDAFASSGDPRRDLLGITAVHPLRRSAVQALLDRSGSGWEVVDELAAEHLVVEVMHRGERFLVRRFAAGR
jgi:wyosine [tRNA(Phe)-imidazoG37] synthetase (radical SAM superfamily)